MKNYPFTNFEEYMYCDDRPVYPMDSFCRLQFSAFLDRAAFERTIRALMLRHPFLRSHVVNSGFRHAWQEFDTVPDPPIKYVQTQENDSFETGFDFIEPLDLNLAGIRFYFVDFPKRTDLIIQFHHTISDGVSAVAFLTDLLTIYGIDIGALPKETPLRDLDNSVLYTRNRYGWNLRRYFRNFGATTATTNQHASRHPVPLFEHRSITAGQSPGIYPRMIAFELDRNETKNYIKRAKAAGVTVNDLLICDNFRAINAWREAKNCDFPTKWTRIMMPMNMRQPWHEKAPICNIVSSVFLDRRKKDFQKSTEELLQGIHRETEWIKTHEQAHVFLLGLREICLVPGLIRIVTRLIKCGATCVMTNLGTELEKLALPKNENGKYQIGDLTLDDFESIPPIRMQTLIGYCALTYSGKLKLCLRYDHQHISLPDAQLFADLTKSLMTDIK